MSLYDFLSQNHFKPFTLVDIRTIARDVMKALAFLKAIKLTHTDLKVPSTPHAQVNAHSCTDITDDKLETLHASTASLYCSLKTSY